MQAECRYRVEIYVKSESYWTSISHASRALREERKEFVIFMLFIETFEKELIAYLLYVTLIRLFDEIAFLAPTPVSWSPSRHLQTFTLLVSLEPHRVFLDYSMLYMFRKGMTRSFLI